MARIVFINPRFEPSYWGLDYALPIFGKEANMVTACLPLMAALTPPEHEVILIDENVEEIDYDVISKADIVGVTGMIVQRAAMRRILTEIKRRGKFIAVGGPWVTVQEDYFDDLADVIFVGEAEDTWPKFLSDWQAGSYEKRYEQLEKTNMARVPVPRFDLLHNERYAFGSLQFTRGCPFQCEFCDIIVTFGRRPRVKTAPQILAELDSLVANGLKIAFIVDDNLIGNKKAVAELLKHVVAWQQEHGYPLVLFTEASLDLAEEPELMELMTAANFVAVFVGIESPSEESLRETKKLQNVSSGASIVERVHTIQDAGLDIWCGMIVGFDSDDASIFERQLSFLREARIAHAMPGMLTAIPKTPLHRRLAEEQRLDYGDPPSFGTNVIPKQMSREALQVGLIWLMRQLYDPEAFLDRMDDLFLDGRFRFGRGQEDYWRRHPWAWWKERTGKLLLGLGLLARLLLHVQEAGLRRKYLKRAMRLLMRRREAAAIFAYAFKCSMHYHHYRLAQEMAARPEAAPNTF